jgi:metal-responsive CopG/Arc/MetJ family transcriptional regulator
MKIKTSVTLSGKVLRAIDRHRPQFKSRSEFLEAAARWLLSRLARAKADRGDLEIVNRHADALNAEAEDVLAFGAFL